MNQVDQNINKDMSDFDLIDVESLDYSDDQTWLYKVPDDSGQRVDIVDWSLSLDWPIYDDEEYGQTEKKLYSVLDNILRNQVLAMPDKHKFDSRTYVKPKKRPQRPSIQSIVEVTSPNTSLTPPPAPRAPPAPPANKYLTYNKYNAPLGPILRLKTFNVDANTDNSVAVKEYAIKRRSLVQDEDPQLEDSDATITDPSERLSSDHVPSKPINIDLSQPAHNLHNTFNKGLTNMMLSDRGSLNMYQSGESLMRMSPPSLVSSLLMESSGNFNQESLDNRKSIASHRESGLLMSGRDSFDPMVTSMTLSILDEKDMSTSFLSQTTYPDNDSMMDSLPPSLVSSVNSSYIVSNTSKPRADSVDSNNVFSSATFTHLEQSQKLLSARPRCHLYNSITKRDPPVRNSESYTKSREEACQIDVTKVLNENMDKTDSPKAPSMETNETITLHYSNNKFRDDAEAEKENLHASFEKDDAFYKEMDIQKPVDVGRNSLNITMDKQELNEIIQARQKLSLARKALPSEPDRPLPNQVDASPVKPLTNQTITVPRKSMENASELLARRRIYTNGFDKHEEPTRDTPKRNATFKRTSPKVSSMDATTVVYVNASEGKMIDINSATLNLLDSGDRTLQHEEWGSQERAMVGSSESTDTGTFSSSSPPESVPDPTAPHDHRIASTPLVPFHKNSKTDLLNLHNTISPIYDMVADKSYTVTRATNGPPAHDFPAPPINTATMVKKTAPKRDILAKVGTERRVLGPSVQQKSPPGRAVVPTASYNVMAPPPGVPRKTGLPTSKLRQYSSHKELRLPVGSNAGPSSTSVPRAASGRSMLRRGVYASNPALSPTAPAPPPAAPARRDSYTIAVDQPCQNEYERAPAKPPTAPPALVRQGTETLRRDRPLSHLVQPKDLRAPAPGSAVPVSMRNHYAPAPTTRPYSVAGATQPRVSRPASVPAPKPVPAPTQFVELSRAASALPRPSRLPAPAPRRALRPPSVYSVAPTADMDHY